MSITGQKFGIRRKIAVPVLTKITKVKKKISDLIINLILLFIENV